MWYRETEEGDRKRQKEKNSPPPPPPKEGKSKREETEKEPGLHRFSRTCSPLTADDPHPTLPKTFPDPFSPPPM
jgi:hypothetical protein